MSFEMIWLAGEGVADCLLNIYLIWILIVQRGPESHGGKRAAIQKD